jgi:hypothetical protein
MPPLRLVECLDDQAMTACKAQARLFRKPETNADNLIKPLQLPVHADPTKPGDWVFGTPIA